MHNHHHLYYFKNQNLFPRIISGKYISAVNLVQKHQRIPCQEKADIFVRRIIEKEQHLPWFFVIRLHHSGKRFLQDLYGKRVKEEYPVYFS